jgi:aspartyl-tRNA(Asn)/glutamyl-tRNA(Gln) amidotransferase subunit A
MTTDAAFATIGNLARRYRDATLGPVEVVDRFLERIERLDGRLGAWQAVYADEARRAAAGAEAALRSGHVIGPFHGIPFALKDIVDLEGRVTTAGHAGWRERVSPATGTIARRLFSAGGILLGKTKTVEVAMGGWGTNQQMGTPHNPWDPDVARTPGGSSSGSGVAVAAGLVTAAVGTDTGGSVRLPAAWCGITGLKVTEAQLPVDGIVPLSHTLDTPGPMVRGAEGALLMYQSMAGVHPADSERDWRAGSGPFAALRAGVAGLRLGTLTEHERAGVAPDVLALYDDAVEDLRSLGAVAEPFAPPLTFEQMRDGTGAIIGCEGYYYHGAMYEDPEAAVDSDCRPRILLGKGVSAREYIAALRQRETGKARFATALAGIHALITPTAATAAVPVAEVDQSGTPAGFTRAANYLGLCALSTPMGLTPGGLPTGLQIITRAGEELLALRIGAAFERAISGVGIPPMAQ